MVFGPYMVIAGMVGHPVDDDLKTHVVRLFYQVFKIGQRTKLRIDGLVIGAGIIAAQGALPFFLADGGNRHKPQCFDTHIVQTGQMFRKGVKGSLGGILPHIHFVHIAACAPIYRCKTSLHKILIHKRLIVSQGP
jgi:hypothetical protein